MQKSRQSNIEALRILSMLMILNLHSFSGFEYLQTPWQLTVDTFRECLCVCCVNLFVLISGYFGIRWKAKSFLNYVFQGLFYFYGIYAFALIILPERPTDWNFLHALFVPAKGWWFFSTYLYLYLASPVLNWLHTKLELKQFIGVTLLLVIIGFIRDYQYTILFFALYNIGAIIRDISKDENKKLTPISVYKLLNNNMLKGGGYLICAIFLTIEILFLCLYLNWEGMAIRTSRFGLNYNHPLIIAQSIFLFNWIKNIKFESKVVNKIAVSVFSVYLIHMHPVWKQDFYNFTGSLYEYSFALHFFILLFLLPCILLLCVTVDLIRIKLFNLFIKALNIK